MPDVVYRSHVRIERVKGPVRRACLPAEREPVIFGVHGAVAEHYQVPPTVLEPIEAAVLTRKMPLWFAYPEYGHLLNDRRLTHAEIQILVSWADAPEGHP